MAPPEERPERSGEDPARGRSRRSFRWLAGGALVAIVAVAAILYWRLPIAGAVLRAVLDRAGYPDAALSVDRLSLSAMRVTGIRWGNAVEIAAAEMGFDFTRLPGLPVERLSLDGVRLDLTAPDARLAGPGEGRGAAITLHEALESAAGLPAVSVRDLTAVVPAGGRTLALTGEMEGGATGSTYAGRFAFGVDGVQPEEVPALSLTGTARFGPDMSAIDAALTSSGDVATGSLKLQAEAAIDAARIGGALNLEIGQPARLSALVPALAGAAGTMRLAVRTTAPVTVPATVPLDGSGLTEVLRRTVSGGVTLDASVAEGDHPTGLSGLSGTLSASARTPGDSAAAARIEGQISLRAARIAAAGATATDALLEGPFHIERQGDAVALFLPQPVRFGAAGVATAGDGLESGPISLSVSGGRTHALRFGLADSGQQADLLLRLELAALELSAGGKAGHRVAIAPATLWLSAARDTDGTIDAHVRSPALSAKDADREAALDDLVLSLRKAGVSTTGEVRTGVTLRQGGKLLIAPAVVRGELALWRAILTFDASAKALDAVTLTARGRHDAFTGRGTAELALDTVRLGRGQVDIAALLPALSGMQASAGTITGSARLAWGADAPEDTAAFRIEGVDLTSGALAAEGLSADVAFDRLTPPRTPPGQTVHVRRIAAGVSIDNLALRFTVEEGVSPGAPAVAVESLSAAFAGGRIAVPPTAIQTGAATNRVRIEIADVDLALLLGLLGLQDISGTGRLSGAIPLVRTGTAVAIVGGSLAAEGPGVLRIRSEAAKSALAQGGEEVALMLRALEDFRYESLTVEIEKAAEGQGNLILRTRGQNPAVGDGQPFIINVNVTGNVDRLAAIAARLLELPTAVLRSMVPGAP